MSDIVSEASILSDHVYDHICRARELLMDNPVMAINDAGVFQDPLAVKGALQDAIQALSAAAMLIEQGRWPTTADLERHGVRIPK